MIITSVKQHIMEYARKFLDNLDYKNFQFDIFISVYLYFFTVEEKATTLYFGKTVKKKKKK